MLHLFFVDRKVEVLKHIDKITGTYLTISYASK